MTANDPRPLSTEETALASREQLSPHQQLTLRQSAPLTQANEVRLTVDQRRAERLVPILNAWCALIEDQMSDLAAISSGSGKEFRLFELAETTGEGEALVAGYYADREAIRPILVAKLLGAGYGCVSVGNEHIVVTLPPAQPED